MDIYEEERDGFEDWSEVAEALDPPCTVRVWRPVVVGVRVARVPPR